MAFIRASQGGGGGEYSETVLWQNNNWSQAFAANSLNLNDNISNYKYIKIISIFNINDSSTQLELIIDTSKIVNYTTTSGHTTFAQWIAGSTLSYFRAYSYVNDTRLSVSDCRTFNSSLTVQNLNCIPYLVIGLK